MDWKEYTGVYTVADVEGKDILPVTGEMVGAARKLADTLHTESAVILAGAGVREKAEDLIALGADVVYVFDSPLLSHYDGKAFEELLVPFLEEKKADVLLGASSPVGRDLIPRLAARLQCGLTADVTELSADEATGAVTFSRPAMGDHVYVDIESAGRSPQAGTVHEGAFSMPEKDAGRKGRIVDVPVTIGGKDLSLILHQVIPLKAEENPVEKADIVVAGGRGIRSREEWEELRSLADLLGGSIGATRPVCDLGWEPRSRQIGQSGKTVSPKVYFAFGISGAMLHMCAVKAGVIIAVNKDPDAPIFQMADYAVVADVKDFLPALIAQVKALQDRKK